LNISYPANGSQKLIDIEDERKLNVFMEKRVRRAPPASPEPTPPLRVAAAAVRRPKIQEVLTRNA
jgi:hypothetical protein